MAANYLTIGSKFQPFSYAELVAPVQAYQNEYDRQEELYNQYAEAAGLIGAELNPELDKDILENTYNPYMQALNEAAATLSSEGLTPGGRAALQSLRRQFGREITPIKVASEARTKARENWDKMLAQDKTLMTNANPYYKGISAYMNGASPDTTYVSGNELYSRGQNLAEAFSKTMREVPEDERLALQGQYFRIVNQYGANSAEADAFMQGAIGRIPALAKQVDGILANSGIDAEGFTPADKERARQYIIEGMKAGLSGQTKVDYMQNRAWDLAAKASFEKPENPEEPFGVMTITGGLDTVKNKDLDRRQAILDVLSYDKVKGDFTTPEIIDLKKRIAGNPAKDLILSDLNIINEVESIIGSPEEAKGYSPGLASVMAYPDFVKRDSNGREISRMSYEEAKNKFGERFADYEKAVGRQKHESSAFSSSVEQSQYMTNQADYEALIDAQNAVDNIVRIGRLISPEDASEVELKENIKRYLDYERAASAMERRTITPQFESASEETNYVNNLLNVAIASLGEGQYSAVEVVDEKGNTRAIKASEAEALLPLLQDNSKFSITGNLNPISKDGKRSSGLKVTFVGDNNNPPANYIIHEDSLDAALRHTNRIYDHLTDFSINKIRNPQVISGAQYNSPDMLYNIKWSEEKDGVQTATVKDRETGEIYNYVKFTGTGEGGTTVQKVVRTTIDDVALGRGILSGQILQNNIINILSNLNKKKKKNG